VTNGKCQRSFFSWQYSGQMRIKICGIRSSEDLKVAVDAGADALGFIIASSDESPDALTVDEARALLPQVPPFVTRVLVTTQEEVGPTIEQVEGLGFDAVQLHSAIGAQEISLLRAICRCQLIGVVEVDESALARAREISPFVDALLLDSAKGTGAHDWQASRSIVEGVSRPVILAGGLTPENVSGAIRTVRPWAVDVNSGVDDASGAKDALAVQAFIVSARHAA